MTRHALARWRIEAPRRRRRQAQSALFGALRRLGASISGSLLVACTLCAQLARADELDESMAALDASDVVRAEALLRGLSPELAATPRALFQRGMSSFLRGDYADAEQLLDQAIGESPRAPQLGDFRKLREWAHAAREITREFARASSRDGRYVVRYQRGPDAVLAGYALAALERADAAIQKHLGIRLPGPIRLEVYPSARTLSEVSSLTLGHIETTGTVALCKWNRLMIASPRSLLYGYPWLDTINHELVHLALTLASANRAPVWFHEGLAKLFERSWRGEAPSSQLTPATDALLVSAAHQKQLIPFERMHPSIAMLPSQEEAALAFAQVVTFLERFRESYADAGLSRAIAAIAGGIDARAALAQVSGKTFDALEQSWQEQLLERPAPGKHEPAELKLRFVEAGKADESLDVQEARARRHLRVGDLLWGSNHPVAAAREYEAGQRFAPGDPILASRTARASLQRGMAERALSALETALKDHPHHAPLYALKGQALLALGRSEESAAALRESIRQNPFDPSPHCNLARAAADASEAAEEQRHCQLLGRSAPSGARADDGRSAPSASRADDGRSASPGARAEDGRSAPSGARADDGRAR
jgi:Flp pilus assembly protein TadD